MTLKRVWKGQNMFPQAKWMALIAVLLSTGAIGQPGTLLKNGDFSATREVRGAASSDEGFGAWRVGENKLAPDAWTLNTAYPGSLEIVEDPAARGGRFLRLTGDGGRTHAHTYQPCPAIKSGGGYMLNARVRGGPVQFSVYEYREDGSIRVPGVMGPFTSADAWREFSGYYFPRGADLKNVSVALIVPKDAIADVDYIELREAPDMVAPADLGPVVIESDLLRISLSPTGVLEEFVCKATGVNYALPDTRQSVFGIRVNGGEVPVRYIQRQGGVIDVQFARPGLRASFKVETRPEYVTIALRNVSQDGVEAVQLCRLGLNISSSVGTLLNAAWNDDFASCVLALNEKTNSIGANGARADHVAWCYDEYGLAGAKVAIIGVPLEPAGSTEGLLDVIERVELDQGLPHPTINGVWIKRAPERFSSYLMAGGASEANIDDVVEFAKGGFGCVELLNWWYSTPRYDPHPSLFPNGLAGMKSCADKIHEAGMEVGLHAMQAMVGWGGVGMGDPYVWPDPDPRLLRKMDATLAGDIAAADTDIAINEQTADWPDKGDLVIGGEMIRYASKTETGFAGCVRGLHKTGAEDHPAGAPVELMVNCFPMWDHVIYAPDVNSSMVDEVCANIARVFNATGADMTYFDGGEEIAVQPPGWHNQGKVALGVFDRLDHGMILEGNAIYSHLAWHVITRGSPHFDPIYYGRRDYTLRNKGQNPARWRKNLLTGDCGWFTAHTQSRSTHAVTPDEVELLCLKAVGGKAPISFIVSSNNLYANKRMPEMLEIIRTCDRLKREDALSEEICAKLSEPWAEHSLSQDAEGRWQVSPQEFGQPQMVSAGDEAPGVFDFENPHDAQRPWLRLRARSRLAEFGAEDNIVLADYAGGIPFEAGETASAELTQRAVASAQTAPDGSAAFEFSASNQSAGSSGWCRLSMPVEPIRDLSSHRAIGLWVRGTETGGILNVQLAQGHGFRDHYIDLDYAGWRYHVLHTGETARYYDYAWPHRWVDLMYWPFNYAAVKGVNLLLNALPANTEVSCLVGRIEALREHDLPVVSPALQVDGRRVAFPVSLQPDEYLELGWDGRCRHFEPNGGLLADVVPEGEITLGTGANEVAFACEAADGQSTRVEITLATRGAPLENSGEPVGEAALPAPPEDVQLVVTPGRGVRLMKGLNERVGRESARAIPALDGEANVWTLTNTSQAPREAVLVVDYTRGKDSTLPDTAASTVIESFADPGAYEMSDANQFAKYVVGGGRVLSESGPVREGVTQSLAPCDDRPSGDAPCVSLKASNTGGAGGWSGKGRRFDPPLDLSTSKALGMWVHGDARGELLKIQFRDVTGAWRDWDVPIDYAGWRRQGYRVEPQPNFDWAQIEYLIFYYNGIPAQAQVEVRLSDMIAATALASAAEIQAPAIVVNGKAISLGEALMPGSALTLDERGRTTRLAPGARRSEPAVGTAAPMLLQPGDNRLELRGEAARAPDGLSVWVVPL